MSAKKKVVSKKRNSKGIIYALVTNGEIWDVWKLCENYDGKVKGGIRSEWRYIVHNTTEQEARQLFDRRTS